MYFTIMSTTGAGRHHPLDAHCPPPGGRDAAGRLPICMIEEKYGEPRQAIEVQLDRFIASSAQAGGSG